MTENDLAQRLAALEAREAALAERGAAIQGILDAADRRDALAEARDLAADTREQNLDLAKFLANEGGEYGEDLPDRRASALDRQEAKNDRSAARLERMTLAALSRHPSEEPVR